MFSVIVGYMETWGFFTQSAMCADTLTSPFRPTQLVSVTVRWTCTQGKERCCTTTSLLWLTSPASTAAPASPAKVCGISTALTWACAGHRWESNDPGGISFYYKSAFEVHFYLSPFLSQGRMPASCVDNVTESGREVKGYVCQSTVVPSDIRSQSLVSSQPFLIGDSLIGMNWVVQLFLGFFAVNEMIRLKKLVNRLLKILIKLAYVAWGFATFLLLNAEVAQCSKKAILSHLPLRIAQVRANESYLSLYIQKTWCCIKS